MLLQRFTDYISTNNLIQPGDRLLLAVSGGVDSVVLCELCQQAGFNFMIAHCNFQLRGEESNRDEAFVTGLGNKYGVKVLVKKFDTATYAQKAGLGIQEAARNLRYNWFIEICKEAKTQTKSPGLNQLKANTTRVLIVTAHHANDSIETLLMNFFKGTGIKGLHGIRPVQLDRPFIIHPLLFATKNELQAFAKEQELLYVEDSSNKSLKYTRNFFRNEVLPLIKQQFAEVESNLMDNIRRFNDIELLYNQAILQHKKKLIEKKGNEIHIPVLKLMKTKPLHTVLYEIIKEAGFSDKQVNDAVALLTSETGRYIQSHSHRIIKNRNWLIVTPVESCLAHNILIEADEKTIFFPKGQIKIKRSTAAEHKIMQAPQVAQLDVNDIGYPLLLRKWKQGDYFYPLGMNKKKKLSRFFIDKKLSLTEKEDVWVIEMNKKIIWVVGMRIDNRFKITGQTQQVLILEWVKKKDE